MTQAELNAIRARRYDWWNCGVPDFSDAKVCSDRAHRDRDALLAEVHRLRELVESLRAFANHFEDCSCWLGDVQLADRPCDCGLRDIDNALEGE